MSAATQFLRGIDMSMALLCIINLALITDSLTSHRTPPALPASSTSAYLSCVIYCLFNLVTLLLILTVRSMPLLCRAAGNDSLAVTFYAVQLGIQMFLLLPRTLIVLSLLTSVLRSRVLLLGDAAHTVFFLTSALVLYIYSCAILVLDCQRVQRFTARAMAPRPARSTDEVRILGMSVFGGPLWIAEHSTSSRTRGLSELEIERVTTLTTFTPAPTGNKRAEDGTEEEKTMEAAQVETAVSVEPAGEQQLSAIESEEQQEAAVIEPPHYHNPPPPPPCPVPPEPAQQTVGQHITHKLISSLRTGSLSHPCAPLSSTCAVVQCPVCLEMLRAGESVLVLPCLVRLHKLCRVRPSQCILFYVSAYSHVRATVYSYRSPLFIDQHLFHPGCIRPWLRRNQACPSQPVTMNSNVPHAVPLLFLQLQLTRLFAFSSVFSQVCRYPALQSPAMVAAGSD